MNPLTAGVHDLRDKRAVCAAEFAKTLAAINAELDAVGGFATTSPERGYCRDYTRQADGFGGGVLVVGEDPAAPTHPEVGDRCFALDQAWREYAYGVTRATHAVAAIVRPFAADHVPDEALVAAAEAVVKCMEET